MRAGSKYLNVALSIVLIIGLLPGIAYARSDEFDTLATTLPIEMLNADALELLSSDGDVIQVALGSSHSAAVKSDGSLWMWGSDHNGERGDGASNIWDRPVKITDDVSQVVLGGCDSAIVKRNGSLWMCGNNDVGQLGDGTTENRHSPVKIMDDVIQVAIDGRFAAAVKSDGSLWMWGSNSCGQLGDGTTEDRHSPVRIMDGVAQVALGLSETAVVKSDGSLWMWGWNSCGQLGDGTTEDRHSPVRILGGVEKIAVPGRCGAAVKSDGSLWTWGDNYLGQIGDGTNENRHSPVKVMDGVAQVASTGMNCAAVGFDGSLWTWGENSHGELGDGTTDGRNCPVKVMNHVVSASFGAYQAAAMASDGSLWMWGLNSCGQLGDGTTEDRYSPAMIMDSVAQVVTGGDCSAAIKSDGSLWMWGCNFAGMLGDGTTESRLTPIKVIDGASPNGLSRATITGINGMLTYTGSPITFPNLKVTLGGKVLVEDSDYTVAYADNVGPGTGRITITGIGSYTGSKTVTFVINDPALAVRTVTVPFGKSSVTFQWGWGMLNGSSTRSQPYRELQKTALVMAAKSEESESSVKSSLLYDFGFDTVDTQNYTEHVNDPSATFAYKRVALDGEDTNVFAVIVRGTKFDASHLSDLLTDISSVVSNGFRTGATRAKGHFERAMTAMTGKSLEQLKKEKNVFLLTGHSLGGATVNHMALDLSEYTGGDDGRVFCYTFSAPHNTDVRVNRRNTFNLECNRDMIAAGYTKFNLRNGADEWWSPDLLANDYSFMRAFIKYVEGDGSGPVGNIGSLPTSGQQKMLEWYMSGDFRWHIVEACMAYLDCVQAGSYVGMGGSAKFRMTRIQCPVDVEVRDASGELVVRTVDNEIAEVVSTEAVIITDGEEKYVFAPADGGYSVRLSGNGSGKMTLTVSDVDAETGAVSGKQVFSDVVIKPGKEMDVTVSESDSADDTRLLVLGNDGAAVSEVAVDGTETVLSAITEQAPATTKATAKNPMTAKAKKKAFAVKASKVKKKAQKVAKPVAVKKAQGKVTFSNASKKKALKAFKVAKDTGSVTVPKATKKGTYKVAVKVAAAGNSSYEAASKTVTVKIRVK